MCTPPNGRQLDGTVRSDFQQAKRENDIYKKNWNLGDDYGPKNEVLKGGSSPNNPFGGRPPQQLAVGTLLGRQSMPQAPMAPPQQPNQPPPPPVQSPAAGNPRQPTVQPQAPQAGTSVGQRTQTPASSSSRQSSSSSIGVNQGTAPRQNSIGLNIPT